MSNNKLLDTLYRKKQTFPEGTNDMFVNNVFVTCGYLLVRHFCTAFATH